MRKVKFGVQLFLPFLTSVKREMLGSTYALLKLIEKTEMKPSRISYWIVSSMVYLRFIPSNLQNSSGRVLKNIAVVEKR